MLHKLNEYGNIIAAEIPKFTPTSISRPQRLRHWGVVKIYNKHLGDYPTPTNLTYLWSFGLLSGLCLGVQLLTGIVLAMHYLPSAELAFSSVEHIMRDVNYGWLIRYMHANGASFFFIVIYTHIARGLYYRSYMELPKVWFIGVIIFFLLMATAFIGYVLPWGQMSFWGATVITNLFSAIPEVGKPLVEWMWGGFAVGGPTLNRFFSLHYLLPFLVAGAAIGHLFQLHEDGSTNPLSGGHVDRISFTPYFLLKDGIAVFAFFCCFGLFVFRFPNLLGHFDNYIEGNALVTPPHIVPEWYFLPFYAILRSIPDKLGGVVCMGAAILILAALPIFDMWRLSTNPRFAPAAASVVFGYMAITAFLGVLGGMPVEAPYILLGQIFTAVYFLYFLLFTPTVSFWADKAIFVY